MTTKQERRGGIETNNGLNIMHLIGRSRNAVVALKLHPREGPAGEGRKKQERRGGIETKTSRS